MMPFEIWELRYRWTGTHKRLLERLKNSASSLDEGVGIPIEADLLDMVPELLDPYLGRSEAEEQCVNMQDDIQRSIKKHGIWISSNQRKAVTRAGVYGDG